MVSLLVDRERIIANPLFSHEFVFALFETQYVVVHYKNTTEY